MNDRELLEAAAKAAGMSYVPGESWDEGAGWNPLEDDGDALRLAVKLRITPAMMLEHIVDAQCGNVFCHEPWGADPYAATRRAIVRAAAAMDKEPGK